MEKNQENTEQDNHQENIRINNKIDFSSEGINEPIALILQENLLPDTSAMSYKKNLIRLLILAGLGFITLALLGISFFFVIIKI